MPDTPGKRQRAAQKAKKRQEKEEKRAAREAVRQDPNLEQDWLTEDGQTEDDQPTDSERQAGDAEEPQDEREAPAPLD
jgi:hypothetical protein